MLTFVAFILLLFASCGYAAAFGGATGRRAAGAILAAWSVGVIASLGPDGPVGTLGVERIGVFCSDVLLLVALIWISLRSPHFWPLWITGFQAAGVASHIAVFFSPPDSWTVIHTATNFWGIPICLAMPVGVWLDRQEARRAGDDGIAAHRP